MPITIIIALAIAVALAAWGITATIVALVRDAPRSVCFDPLYDSRQPSLRR